MNSFSPDGYIGQVTTYSSDSDGKTQQESHWHRGRECDACEEQKQKDRENTNTVFLIDTFSVI